jgi:hypothetical protein
MIVSPTKTLGSMNSLVAISLSHNHLTNFVDLPEYDVDGGTAGGFLALMTTATTQTLNVEHNYIAGSWINSWPLNNLISLNAKSNFIQQFPPQLMINIAPVIQVLDLSDNDLHGYLPGSDESFAPTRTFSSLDLRGNPNFKSADGSLPDWTVVNDEYSKTLNEPFLCPTLGSMELPTMSLKLDPSYYSYSTCVCDRGTFGSPPDCYIIPESQDIENVQYPVFSHLNDTFTDSWYGDQRMTSGLSTSWVIDKRVKIETSAVDKSVPALSTVSSASTLSSSTPSPASTIFEVQSSSSSSSNIFSSLFSSFSSVSGSSLSSPVLMINITFYVNLDLFTEFTDILDIYEGKNKNTSKRIKTKKNANFII